MQTELTAEDRAIFRRFFNGQWSCVQPNYSTADRADASIMRKARETNRTAVCVNAPEGLHMIAVRTGRAADRLNRRK